MLYHRNLPKQRKGKRGLAIKSEGAKDTQRRGVKSWGCSREDQEFSVVSTKWGAVGNEMERSTVECFQAGEWPA